MSTTSRRITVICPKCGEDNADNFRFCGMCGAVLTSTVPAGAPRGLTVREGEIPVALTIPANPRKARAEKPVEPISGPSVLGLGQSPTLDSLRDKAFSGSDPIFEVEEPRTGARKLLLLLLLAALGAAAWWTYTNYVAIGQQEPAVSHPKATLPASPAQRPATSQPAPTATTNSDTTPANPTPSGATPSQHTESPPEKANANPESKPDTATAAAEPPVAEKNVKAAPPAKADRRVSTRDSRKAAMAAKAAPPPAADTGDADFRKGVAYLYGRGGKKNCDAAIKNLKVASAKLNPRARSTFGTMYATGHCVPRDLPTSYSWFALALRVDPNNQVLEKDLRAIWNQMTPPERQLATKLK
jgi:hypothetical protein